MKGTIFQKPLELNLRVDGESWNQGDSIQGLLTVKNHDAQVRSLADIKISLAYGELKKVRAKSEEAFDLLSSVGLESPIELQPQKEFELPWKFELDRNAPITDNTKSLFLLYGQGGETAKLGQLQLPIHPYWTIQEWLDVFKVGFRFVVKSKRMSRGWVEAKLDPPDSTAFVALDQCVLRFHFEGDTLQVEYSFHLKKVAATAGSIDITKQRKEFEQTFPANQILLPSGRFNHEPVETAIRDALSQL